MTYLSTASFITYLVPFAFLYVRRSGHGARKDGPRTWWEHLGFRLPPLRYPDPGRAVTADDGAETQPLCADCDGARDDAPLSIIETAALAMEFAVIWFVANWTFVMALACTSVASGTTLGSTSGFFTLLLGSMWGVETFTPGKLLTVLTSSLGVLLVTHADRVSTNAAAAPSHALLGDALALFSAVCYAGYVILLKVRIGSESRISMPLFLGFVGAFNLVAFWPLGVVLHWTGYEPFEMPHDRLMWMGVLVNMGITVVSYVWGLTQRLCLLARHAKIVAPVHDSRAVAHHSHGTHRRQLAVQGNPPLAKWHRQLPGTGTCHL